MAQQVAEAPSFSFALPEWEGDNRRRGLSRRVVSLASWVQSPLCGLTSNKADLIQALEHVRHAHNPEAKEGCLNVLRRGLCPPYQGLKTTQMVFVAEPAHRDDQTLQVCARHLVTDSFVVLVVPRARAEAPDFRLVLPQRYRFEFSDRTFGSCLEAHGYSAGRQGLTCIAFSLQAQTQT